MTRQFLVVLIAVGTATSSCSGRSSDLLDLVPRSSFVLMRVHWPAVLNNPELERAVNAAEFRSVFRQVGLSDDQVTEVVTFATLDGGRVDRVVAVRTRMSARDLRALVKAFRSTLQSNEPLSAPRVDGPLMVRIAGPSTIVIGSVAGVTLSLEGRSKGRLRLRDDRRLTGLLSRIGVSEARPVTGMLSVPEEIEGVVHAAMSGAADVLDLMNVGPIGQLLSRIGVVRGMALGVSHWDSGWPVELAALMQTEQSAALVLSTLTVAKGLGALFEMADGRTGPIEGLGVGRLGSQVTVNFVLPTLGPPSTSP